MIDNFHKFSITGGVIITNLPLFTGYYHLI